MNQVIRQKTQKGSIALRQSGQGSAVVFLHGLGGSSKSWSRQLINLSESYHVIAWDCPGYGDSDDFPGGRPATHDFAKALLSALDNMGIGEFSLVGHSMGGAVAPWIARLAPMRVKRLVLSATKVSFGSDDPSGYDMRLAERRQMDDETFGRARAKSMVGEDSPVFEEVASIAGEIRVTGYEGAIHLLKNANNAAILPTIEQPTLVVAGANDKIAPTIATKAVAHAVPGAHLITIPNAGHAAYMEQPEIYSNHLKEFLTL
jgi:pimeloyl-ACP methyl ester carboxylesterase